MPQAPSLPTGTLTFLFSDIEGSTRLVNALGPGFGAVLDRHHEIIRAAVRTNDGIVVSTEGDAFFVVFPSAPAAVEAAAAAQRALADEAWPAEAGAVRVRMGLHTGEGTLGGDNYVGLDIHRAARIANAGHGGQVLVSKTTHGLVASALAGGGLQLRELGEFRLKDLEQPETLFQLTGPGLADDFPPPRTLDAPSNLPAQVTSFVGRETEVDAVAALLHSARLVTLTGPGGTGKTRLSLGVAERLRHEFTGGTYFVELETLTDANLVAPEIAQALKLREDPKLTADELLGGHLRDRHILLVLDNLEQFRGGVPVVGTLLQAAPNLAVLATSREPLRIRGEQEFPVPPLGLPDPKAATSAEQLSGFEAVVLFVQRARAVRPDFAVTDSNAAAVAAICRRLDGLPLAIELAAARCKLFSPEAILSRLEQSLGFLASGARDLPERQRTLRGAIDWSYKLLDPGERQLFGRLGIFVGGWTAESAGAVCDPDGELGLDVLDTLASFVDRSLVVAQAGGESTGEPRFRMLETIREYAVERLAESADADTVRRRHQDHFATLAKEAEPELLDATSHVWLDRLEAESDNLREAILRAADDGRIELALDAGAALWRFWQQRSRFSEGRATLESLLARPEAGERSRARARALGGLGGLVYWQGDFRHALEIYNDALSIQRELDDRVGLADALYNAGFAAAILGNFDQAEMNYQEATAILEAAGDRRGLVKIRDALVFLRLKQGRYDEARVLQAGNLAVFRQVGAGFRIANALTQLGAVNLMDGAYEEARAAYAEALGMFRKSGDMSSIYRLLLSFAILYVRQGDYVKATRLVGAADTIKASLGDAATPMQVLGLEDPAAVARAALGDDPYAAAYEGGNALSLDEIAELVSGKAR